MRRLSPEFNCGSSSVLMKIIHDKRCHSLLKSLRRNLPKIPSLSPLIPCCCFDTLDNMACFKTVQPVKMSPPTNVGTKVRFLNTFELIAQKKFILLILNYQDMISQCLINQLGHPVYFHSRTI